MKLSYSWSDAEFHDPEVINAMARHPDIGALARMMVENETWVIPGFRPWRRAYVLGEQNLPELKALPTHAIGSFIHCAFAHSLITGSVLLVLRPIENH